MTDSTFNVHERGARIALACLRGALEDRDLDAAQRHHRAYGAHLAALGEALDAQRQRLTPDRSIAT